MDDDASTAPTVSTYKDFVQCVDFLELVHFMSILASKSSPAPIDTNSSEELDGLMRESSGIEGFDERLLEKGTGGIELVADFIEVLMVESSPKWRTRSATRSTIGSGHH